LLWRLSIMFIFYEKIAWYIRPIWCIRLRTQMCSPFFFFCFFFLLLLLLFLYFFSKCSLKLANILESITAHYSNCKKEFLATSNWAKNVRRSKVIDWVQFFVAHQHCQLDSSTALEHFVHGCLWKWFVFFVFYYVNETVN